MKEWEGFKGTNWQKGIDVADFIKSNYKEYTGDDSFLSGISKKTEKVWNKCVKLLDKEYLFFKNISDNISSDIFSA